MKSFLKRPVFFFVAIGVAVLIATALVKSRKPLEHTAQSMPSRSVEVITIDEMPYRTRATGYGNVVPSITLNSMAEVSGKISFVHPNLKSGEMIPANTVVARIDPKDYAVTLKQTEADLAAKKSELVQLDEEEKTTRRSFELATRNLQVEEKEYQRIEEVYKKGLIAKSTLDAEEQKVISLRQSLEELQGKINGFASRRQSIQAQVVRAEREVENSTTRLGRTEISLPFDARIGDVNIEENEFVSVGAQLFEATDLQGVEITAQLPLPTMRKLVASVSDKIKIQDGLKVNRGPIAEQLQLTSKVSLVSSSVEAEWEAKVLRISESIDQTRQTVGVVVGVDRPYEKIIPGQRPPLLKGMYTAVELFAPPKEQIVIPRKAIHEGRVYIANGENKLEIRPVEIMFTQGNMAVIKSGLSKGDRVVITDLFPVIEHMPLEVTEAVAFLETLRKQAIGEI